MWGGGQERKNTDRMLNSILNIYFTPSPKLEPLHLLNSCHLGRLMGLSCVLGFHHLYTIFLLITLLG